MKKITVFIAMIFLFSCSNNSGGQDTASPGTLQPAGALPDTTKGLTDSVLMPDRNTADIDVMKKIN